MQPQQTNHHHNFLKVLFLHFKHNLLYSTQIEPHYIQLTTRLIPFLNGTCYGSGDIWLESSKQVKKCKSSKRWQKKFAQSFITGFPQCNVNCEQETWRKAQWWNFAEKSSAETLKSNIFTCRPLIKLEPLLNMFYQVNWSTLPFWRSESIFLL